MQAVGRRLLGASLLVLANAAAAPAWAQITAPPEQTQDDAAAVPEIVVTAQKREERLLNVPASITAESQDALQRRGATQLEDIIRNTPGISNAGPGQGNNTAITIRGVSTGTGIGLKQATVSLLFDDIPVDPNTAAIGTTNLRTVDIERVEVLRGPQGTLFGSGALSGAVRFITNKPNLDTFGGAAELTVATTHRGEESFAGNAVVNVPLVDDKLGIRAVGYGYQDGGWVDNLATGQRDVNRVETYGGRLAVAFRPTDRLSLTLTGIYQDSEDKGSGESLYALTLGASDFGRQTSLFKSPSSDLENKLVDLAAEYDLGAVSLFSSTTYGNRKSSTESEAGFYLPLLGFLLGVPGLSGEVPGQTGSDFDNFTQELRLSSNGSGPLRWTIGGFYLKSDGGGRQTVTAAAIVPIIGTSTLAQLDTKGGQEELAAFGEATYTIANRLDLTAGMRVSRTTVKFATESAGILLTQNPNPAFVVTTDIEQKETVANPRFSVAYRPSTNATFYVQAARGYRVGGPNLSAGLGGGGVPTSYKSDSLWNYEVGAKARLADGRVRLSGAAFYIDWSDIQTALVINNVNYTGNAGSARIKGLEFEAAVRPVDNFEVGGSFLLSDNELTDDVPELTRVTGTLGVFDGERLPASPERQATGYAELSIPAIGDGGYVRGTVQYIGDQFTDFGERGSKFGDYTTLDLRAGVNLGSLEVVAFANNVFDSQGKRSAFDLAAVGPIIAQPQLAYRVRPRTFGLTLRARFGGEAR